MKNKKLLALLCIVVILAGTVMGTLAYLTDQDKAVNTFTVGKVGIKLDETLVDENGEPILDENDEPQRTPEDNNGNNYHLLPGMSYLKDPMVTVNANSEESYIRMVMTVHNASAVQALIDNHNLGDFSALIEGWDETVWLYKGFTEDTTANTIAFEFRYFETVDTDADDLPLAPLFTTLVVPGATTGEELAALYDGGFQMVIEGHAIQAAGFEDIKDENSGEVTKTAEDAAWEAFDAQVNG